MRKKLQLVIASLCMCIISYAQQTSQFIHVDQFGYLPDASKVAVLSDPITGFNANLSYTPPPQLELRNADTDAVVYSAAPAVWNGGAEHDQSGDRGWWFDFSSINTPGTYYIYDASNGERSATFEISDQVYTEVLKAASRMFYYNRCGIEKPASLAGTKWADAISFSQDTQTRYYFDQNNTSLVKDMSGGWFDAGDYNKYVTFANSVIHDLLWAYQENPDVFTDNWDIPESGNGIPDILDEVKWELDWLLKMNNPDGSTHIKMGSKNYDENTASPPSSNNDQRYYGPTCSSASIAVAGMFAHAARVYKQIPGMEVFANLLETRAISAWEYVIPKFLNGEFDENCDNGEIVSGDADWYENDQREAAVTAASHLLALTGNAAYNNYFIDNYQDTEPMEGAFWGPYKLPLIDALMLYTTLPQANGTASTLIKNAFAFDAFNNWNGYFGFTEQDLYRAYMPDWSYHWGSNNTKSGYGTLNLLLSKYNMDGEQTLDYQKKASEQMHYFHGVNPLGIVYLSNMYDFGAEHCVNQIYHGWFADGTDYDHALDSPLGPPPGYVTGGANADFSVSTLTPPAGQPLQKSYLDFNDDWPNNSWEISEPAIYYQASYIRLLSWFAGVESTPTDVNDVDQLGQKLQVFPNPTKKDIRLITPFNSFAWQLLDLNGKIINSNQSTENIITVSINHLPAGTYLIRVIDQAHGETLVEKVVKQ